MKQPAARPGTAAPQAPPDGVELALTAGRSETPRATFTAEVPPQRTMIGTGADAGWRVAAGGVVLRHAEIAWDGKQLWVRDAGSPAGTYVGIERIYEWRALAVGDTLQLGEASFVVTAPGAGAAAASDDDAIEAIEADDEEFADVATSVAQAPAGFADDSESTRALPQMEPSASLARNGAAARGAAPAGAAGGGLSRGGVQSASASASAASLPRAPTTNDVPGNDTFETAQDTVVGAMPTQAQPNAQPARPATVPPPRVRQATPGVALPAAPARIGVGANAAPPSDESTVAIVTQDGGPVISSVAASVQAGLGASGGVAPLAAPQGPYAQPGAGAYGQPALPLAHGEQPGMPPDPGYLPPGELTSTFGSIPPPVADPNAKPTTPLAKLKEGFAALPRRTKVMAGATFLGGVIVLAMLSMDDEPPPRPPAAAPRTTNDPALSAAATQLAQPIPGGPAGENGRLLAFSPPPAPPPEPPPTPRGHRAPPPPAAPPYTSLPERVAADAVSRGQYPAALALYQALAIQHPDVAVYSHLRIILQRKLEAQRSCPPGSTTCAPRP